MDMKSVIHCETDRTAIGEPSGAAFSAHVATLVDGAVGLKFYRNPIAAAGS